MACSFLNTLLIGRLIRTGDLVLFVFSAVSWNSHSPSDGHAEVHRWRLSRGSAGREEALLLPGGQALQFLLSNRSFPWQGLLLRLTQLIANWCDCNYVWYIWVFVFIQRISIKASSHHERKNNDYISIHINSQSIIYSKRSLQLCTQSILIVKVFIVLQLEKSLWKWMQQYVTPLL